MPLPDNRLRLQAPKINFTTQVGLTGQAHDDFPAPRTQARYDHLRIYLQALLANQSSFSEPSEYRTGSLWFNLNTDSMEVRTAAGWQDLSNAIRLDSATTLQDWYDAVRLQLTGDPSLPEPFSKAVFTTGSYNNPTWLTGLSASKITGTIDASKISGTLDTNLFPQLAIGTTVGDSTAASVLFINGSGKLSEDPGAFTYNSTYNAIQMRPTVNAPSLQIDQQTGLSDASLSLALQGVPKLVLGAAGQNNAGAIGSISGDVYFKASGSVLVSSDGGTTVAFRVGSNGVVKLGNSVSNDQLLMNQGASTKGVLLSLQRAGVTNATVGLSGSGSDKTVPTSALDDLVLATRSGAVRIAPGNVEVMSVRSGVGVTVSGDVACVNVAASGYLHCGAITASTATFSGAITVAGLVVTGGSITGSGAGLTGVPQAAITGLATSLAAKADDSAVLHLSGAESAVGAKQFSASSAATVPVTVKGAASQTANLFEAKSSGGTVLASIDKDGKFTGDGSGLSNISISIGSLSGTLPVANGGTGGTTQSAARTGLGLVPGTDVQAYSARLGEIAGITAAKGKILAMTGTGWFGLAAGTDGQHLIADSASTAGVKWSSTLSSPGDGTHSENFGASATATANDAVAVGYAANAGLNGTALGSSTTAGSSGVAVGKGATTSGTGVAVGVSATGAVSSTTVGYTAATNNSYDVAIGYGAASSTAISGVAVTVGYNSAAGGNCVAIGSTAKVNSGLLNSIAIGAGATATAANQFVVGSATSKVNETYIGAGVTGTLPGTTLLTTTGGSGTDSAGTDLVLAAGRSTGSANSGSVVFKYAPASTTGTTMNSLVECGRFNPSGTFSSLSGVFQPTSTATVPLTVKGASSQLADLQRWTNSSGTVLMRVTKDGQLGFGSSTPAYPIDLASSSVSRLVNLALSTASGSNYGVYGTVSGAATNNFGAYHTVTSGLTANVGVTAAVTGTSGSINQAFAGVVAGGTSQTNYGLSLDVSEGASNVGVASTVRGVGSSNNYAVAGYATNTNTGNNYGIYGIAYGGTNNYAGMFNGRLGIKVNPSDTSLFAFEVRNAADGMFGGVNRYGSPYGSMSVSGVAEGRLSLSSTDSFPMGIGGATGSTIYYVPDVGSNISVISPQSAMPETMSIGSGLSLSLSSTSTSTNYDVFVVNDGSGALSLSLTQWGGSTAGASFRSTALVRNAWGMLTKSGAANYRYVGTIRTTIFGGSADTPTQSFVWNYHNRRVKKLSRRITTASWNYNVNCWRPIDKLNTTEFKHVELIIGYQDGVTLDFSAHLVVQPVGSSLATVGLALDADVATADCAWLPGSDLNGMAASTGTSLIQSRLVQQSAAGYHYLTALENVVGNATVLGGGWTSGVIGYYTG